MRQMGIPTRDIWGMFPNTKWIVEVRPDHMETDPADFGQAPQGAMMGQQPRTRDIWGMFPVTMQLEEKRPDHMEADAAYFGQAQQGVMMGQIPMSTPAIPGQQQWLPIGQTTAWEIENPRRLYTIVPAIEYGGIFRIGEPVQIKIKPFDELAERYGIMQSNPFAGIKIETDDEELKSRYGTFKASPMEMGRPFLRQVRLLGQFSASP